MNIGEFAELDGKIVKIIDKKGFYKQGIGPVGWKYKIKFLNDNLTHWVNPENLKSIPNQKTPKVLFD